MKKVLASSSMLLICGLGMTEPVSAQDIGLPTISQNEARDALKPIASALLPAGAAADSRNNVVISADGKVGFFSASLGDSVYAVDAFTGKILSSVRAGDNTSRISLFDDGKRRLLAVANPNDPARNGFASVTVLDASNAHSLPFLSAFILPSDENLSPFINPVFTGDGKRVIAAGSERGALFLFDSETGRMLDRLEIENGIDGLTISNQGTRSIIGAVGASARSVGVFELSNENRFVRRGVFNLPCGLNPANNFCINRTGTIGYIAGIEADKLFSFDIDSGALIDSVEVGDSPAQIALTEHSGRQYAAVVNMGVRRGFLSETVSIIEVAEDGHFGIASAFVPPLGADLSSDSNIVFGKNGDFGLVGGLDGSVYMFSITGKQLAELKLFGQTAKLAFNEKKRRLIVLGNSHDAGYVSIIRVERGKALASLPHGLSLASIEELRGIEVFVPSIASKPISKPRIGEIKVGRIRRGLKLSVYGEGFHPGSQIFINGRIAPTSGSSNRLVARPSWGFIGSARELRVMVQNPDGAVSVQFDKPLKRRSILNVKKAVQG